MYLFWVYSVWDITYVCYVCRTRGVERQWEEPLLEPEKVCSCVCENVWGINHVSGCLPVTGREVLNDSPSLNIGGVLCRVVCVFVVPFSVVVVEVVARMVFTGYTPLQLCERGDDAVPHSLCPWFPSLCSLVCIFLLPHPLSSLRTLFLPPNILRLQSGLVHTMFD